MAKDSEVLLKSTSELFWNIAGKLLKLCVDECISRETFNNKGDVKKMLQRCRVTADSLDEFLDALNEMMLRRHQIVHQGDVPRGSSSAEAIDYSTVSRWENTTAEFCARVLQLLTNQEFAAEFTFKPAQGEVAYESCHPLFKREVSPNQ